MTTDPSMPEYALDVTSSDVMQIHERLVLARQNAGYKTGAAAAKAMGVKYPTYASHENGSRGMQREASDYARFFNVSLVWLLQGKGQMSNELGNPSSNVKLSLPLRKAVAPNRIIAKIKVVGRVAAGVFREVEPMNAENFPDSPFPPDPNWPVTSQFDLIVEGNSINRFARDGEVLRCVDLNRSAIELVDGDLVVVRKTDLSGKIETTAKRARRRNGGWDLWFDSDDPKYQGIVPMKAADGDEIEMIAVVLYAYRPARPLFALT